MLTTSLKYSLSVVTLFVVSLYAQSSENNANYSGPQVYNGQNYAGTPQQNNNQGYSAQGAPNTSVQYQGNEASQYNNQMGVPQYNNQMGAPQNYQGYNNGQPTYNNQGNGYVNGPAYYGDGNYNNANAYPNGYPNNPNNAYANNPNNVYPNNAYPQTVVEKDPPKPEKKRENQSLQSMNFILPIEKETWKVGAARIDWSSIGYGFNWARYKVEKSGYSSVFGLSIGGVSGSIDAGVTDIDLNGLDINMKMGWGMSPVADDLIVAFHFLLGFDFKMLEGDFTEQVEEDSENESDRQTSITRVAYTYYANYLDMIVGGDLILAYNISESFGIIGGVDVTTNLFGIGAFGIEVGQFDDSTKLSYMFSGINIAPHLGVYFKF